MISSCYSKKYCIFAFEGRLFSESADRLHNGFLLLHPVYKRNIIEG